MKRVCKCFSVFLVVFCMLFSMSGTADAMEMMRQNQQVAKAANQNLALNKQTEASDVESGTSFTAALAVDGNAGTRWASNKDDHTPKGAKWLQIDFGETTTFDMVDIQWEQQNIQDFELQVSDDTTAWATVFERNTAPTSKMDSITLSTPAVGRYLRIYIKDYNGDWPSVSIYEAAVYNSKNDTPEVTGNYEIYPTPQKVTDTNKAIKLTQEVNVIKESGIDEVTKQRIDEVLQEHAMSAVYSHDRIEGKINLYVGINGSLEAGDQHADIPRDVFTESENKYDMHVVKVFENGDIVILGKDSDAAFYGLATLEQMLDQSSEGEMKVSVFEDYAFQKYRGAVEGYYGYPWSVEGTLSWMDYAKRYKMNIFLYGPKSDPYHLGKWDEDYPAEVAEQDAKNGVRTQDEMHQYAEAAAASKVSFVWVAHPAMQKPIDFTNEETIAEGLDRLMTKFDSMYQLGVRQFGIFVDDISDAVAAQTCDMQIYMLNQIQERLYDKYNKESSSTEDKVKPLFFTPAWYTTNSGGASSNLPKLKNVHEDVEICFTGNNVFSSISNASATTFKNWIGRTPVMWWNYPVNDAEDSVFFTNPINFDYSQDPNPTNIKGVLSNPMNFSEASKVAFFGLADYTWNPQQFDAEKNWENSFQSIFPHDEAMAAALREVYGNLNDDFVPTDVKRLLAGYQPNDKNSAKAIKEKMYDIMNGVKKIETLKNSDQPAQRLLVEEAQTSFNKLYDMAEAIGGAMAVLSSDDAVEQMRGYYMANAANERLHITRNERYKIISLEGAGEDIYNSVLQAIPSDEGLRPFVPTAMAAIENFDVQGLDTSSIQIENISITPNEEVAVKQGASQQFFAEVQANVEQVSEVEWSVEGAEKEGTVISRNGVLTVDKNELAATINVKATSVYDRSKTASMSVMVKDREYIDPTIPVNMGPTATILGSSGRPATGEGPENIFDDSDTTKWCPGNNSNNNQWVAFDLGAVKQISRWQTVGGGIEHELYAPSAFSLQVLKDPNPSDADLANSSYLSNNNNWEIVAEYKNNTENITNRNFDTPVEGRYFRFFVANGTQSGAPYPATRIFETRIYGVDKEIIQRTHTLTIDPEIQNGSLTVDAAHFEEGAKVNITVEANEQYQLKAGSLRYNGNAIEGTSFLMPSEDVVITAEFEPIESQDLYRVTIAALSNGMIETDISQAKAGEQVSLAIKPAQGYQLKANSLQINNGAVDIAQDMTFIMPAKDVEIYAEFELIPAQAPVIEKDLEASYEVVAGAKAELSVSAAGDGVITYQWYHNDTAVEGATASDYTIDKASIADAGSYYVIITNTTENGSKKTIQSTVSQLIVKEDTTFMKSLLKAAMDKAEALIASDDFKALAPNVQAMINVRLREATAVYNDEKASMEACKTAWLNLADALHYAGFKADKTMLKALIDECEAINTDKYTEASVKAFKDALAEANTVYADQNALQERIDATYSALSTAKDGLTEQPTETVDKSVLLSLIDTAKGKVAQADKYVKNADWEAFVEALAKAEEVYANENATQEEVNKAATELGNAYLNIRLIPSEEMLKQLEDFINYTKKINRALYSAKDLKVIDDAANKAQEMFDKKEFSEDEFDAFAATMGNVMDMIDHNKIEKPADQNKNDDKQNGVKAPGTSDTTNAAGLFLLLIAGCGAMIISKKHKMNVLNRK